MEEDSFLQEAATIEEKQETREEAMQEIKEESLLDEEPKPKEQAKASQVQ